MSQGQFLIYNYINPEHHPESIAQFPGHIIFPQQLNRIGIPKETTIFLGERIKSVYYDRIDEEGNYQDPFIKVDYVFGRNEKGLVLSKGTTISYMLDTGEWSDQTKSGVEQINSLSYP